MTTEDTRFEDQPNEKNAAKEDSTVGKVRKNKKAPAEVAPVENAEIAPAEGQNVTQNLKAKKDWHILSGKWDKKHDKHEIDIRIKAGDDVGALALPAELIEALKAEKVI